MVTQERPQRIFDWLAEQPTLARMLAAARRLETSATERVPVRFAIVRNVTLEPGLPACITVECARLGLAASTFLGAFDDLAEVFVPSSPLYTGDPDIVVVALRLHALSPRLVHEFASLSLDEAERLETAVRERVRSVLGAIRERTAATVLIHTFERPPHPAFGLLDRSNAHGQLAAIDRLNAAMALECERGGMLAIDLDGELARIGYDNAFDERYWHIARAPYRLETLRRLAATYAKAAAALKGKTKKCLVLDCDNTLWGGVVGEEGLAGIALGPTAPGSAFVELHAAVLDLHHRGVLLALNSKNNEADVLEVLERHPQSLLRAHHFATTRINWSDKAKNLRDIASELGIGVDALVFVDDNPVECAFVRDSLPEVATIELPRDPSRFARTIRELPYFDTLAVGAEDRRRTELYRNRAKRSQMEASSESPDDFLTSLEMVLTIGPGDAFATPRIAQLTQKTNQFNLTTRRYGEARISELIADPAWSVSYAELRDTFDASGIVAVALVRTEGDDAVIDTLLMSCRVIGRGVEDALVASVAAGARAAGRRRLIGEFVPTEKNGLVAGFYERLGFAERAGTERRTWTYDLDREGPPVPAWFAAIDDRTLA